MGYIIWFAAITALSLMYLAVILVCDQHSGIKMNGKMLAVSAAYILLAAGAVSRYGRESAAEGALLCFLFAYLAAASYSDVCTKHVYRFLYIPPALAGCAFIALQGLDIERIVPVVIYIFLLAVLFDRYFGRADTIAFMITSCFFTHRNGIDILMSGFLHMLFSIVLVIIIKHKKINFKDGSIEPTAFMPYIAVAALVLIWSGRYA